VPAEKGQASGRPRKPRADAERNRNRLLEVATTAFVDVGPEVSLDEIARRAGVGIGTLYRHFPTRDAILEAVYRRAVQQLAEAAGRLIETEAPIEALRAWMGLFIDYIATKKIIAPALNALTDPSALFATSGMQIKSAIATLVERAAAQGDIQPDVNPIDLLYALVGFANANSAPDWEPRARRLVNILIAGLKPPARVD